MSTRWRVVVTRRLPAAVEAALAERFEVQRNDDDHPFTVAELRAAIAGADAVLPTVTDRLTAEVFADATGTVTRVHEGAVPGDLSPIEGGPGVQFVLEINAGLAAKIGLGPGAQMRHPAIPSDTAVWPCDG